MATKKQMARAPSEEEIQLRKRARRRLVGAIALVVAAIVFLPMLLDTKPEQRSQEIDIRIPPEDSVEEYSKEAAPPATRSDSTSSLADALTAEKPPAGAPGNEPTPRQPSAKPDMPGESGRAKPVEENKTAKAVDGNREKFAWPCCRVCCSARCFCQPGESQAATRNSCIEESWGIHGRQERLGCNGIYRNAEGREGFGKGRSYPRASGSFCHT